MYDLPTKLKTHIKNVEVNRHNLTPEEQNLINQLKEGHTPGKRNYNIENLYALKRNYKTPITLVEAYFILQNNKFYKTDINALRKHKSYVVADRKAKIIPAYDILIEHVDRSDYGYYIIDIFTHEIKSFHMAKDAIMHLGVQSSLLYAASRKRHLIRKKWLVVIKSENKNFYL
jgi:hypothetical protein